jgi:hypothetical protein
LATFDGVGLLVGLAAEYNDALLAIENANVGWDTVQTAIDRGVPNAKLEYKSKTKKVLPEKCVGY